MAEFYRIAHVLRASGLALETDCGLSDLGDPWFAFIHADSGEVVAHFARIDGMVHAVGLPSGQRYSAPDLRSIVAQLMQAQPMLRPTGTGGKSSLSFLPIVALTTFVAAGLLAANKAHAAPSDHPHGDSAPGGAAAIDHSESVTLIDGAAGVGSVSGMPAGDQASNRKVSISLTGAVKHEAVSAVTARGEGRFDAYAQAAAMIEQFAVVASALAVSGVIGGVGGEALSSNWWDGLTGTAPSTVAPVAPVSTSEHGVQTNQSPSDPQLLSAIGGHGATAAAIDGPTETQTPTVVDTHVIAPSAADHGGQADRAALGQSSGVVSIEPLKPSGTPLIAVVATVDGSGATPQSVALSTPTSPAGDHASVEATAVAKPVAVIDANGVVALTVSHGDGQFSLLSISLIRQDALAALTAASEAKISHGSAGGGVGAAAPETAKTAAPAPSVGTTPTDQGTVATPAVDPSAPLIIKLDGSDTVADAGNGLAYIYYQGGNVILKNFTIGLDRVYISNPMLDGVNPTAHSDAQHDLILDFGGHATLTLVGALPPNMNFG